MTFQMAFQMIFQMTFQVTSNDFSNDFSHDFLNDFLNTVFLDAIASLESAMSVGWSAFCYSYAILTKISLIESSSVT